MRNPGGLPRRCFAFSRMAEEIAIIRHGRQARPCSGGHLAPWSPLVNEQYRGTTRHYTAGVGSIGWWFSGGFEPPGLDIRFSELDNKYALRCATLLLLVESAAPVFAAFVSRRKGRSNISGHPWIFRGKRAVQAHAAKWGWGAPVHCPDVLPHPVGKEVARKNFSGELAKAGWLEFSSEVFQRQICQSCGWRGVGEPGNSFLRRLE